VILSQDLVTLLLLDQRDAQLLQRLVHIGLHVTRRESGGLRTTAELDGLLAELHRAADNPYPATMSAIGRPNAPISQHEITTAEASLLLGCSDRHVRRRCQMGSIAARRVGRDWLVDSTGLADAEDDDERRNDQATEPVERDPGQERRGRR
jgi:excisionase family DNA binding protein